jgi:hypothetical protein
MSEHFVKVDEVETVESSNSTALIVLVVSILAIVVLGLAFWQPWATPVQSNSTTVIHDNTVKQVPNPSDSRQLHHRRIRPSRFTMTRRFAKIRLDRRVELAPVQVQLLQLVTAVTPIQILATAITIRISTLKKKWDMMSHFFLILP